MPTVQTTTEGYDWAHKKKKIKVTRLQNFHCSSHLHSQPLARSRCPQQRVRTKVDNDQSLEHWVPCDSVSVELRNRRFASVLNAWKR